MEKLLIGVDFASPSVRAAQWVTRHFAPTAELVLAHVVDLPHFTGLLQGSRTVTPQLAAAARGFEETRLREVAATLADGGARTVVRFGRPYDELASLATEIGADLVVIGPHGDRPPPWKLLGTTAERLVRAAAPAVLVVAHPKPRHPRHLLVAVDDGPATPAVLEWARDLSRRFRARVTALHVVEPVAVGTAAVQDEGTTTSTTPPDARDHGSRWRKALAAAGIDDGRSGIVVRHGAAGDAILAAAAELDADVILMGRRGAGTMVPATLGSTVHAVLLGAACPVLVVTEESVDWDHDQ